MLFYVAVQCSACTHPTLYRRKIKHWIFDEGMLCAFIYFRTWVMLGICKVFCKWVVWLNDLHQIRKKCKFRFVVNLNLKFKGANLKFIYKRHDAAYDSPYILSLFNRAMVKWFSLLVPLASAGLKRFRETVDLLFSPVTHTPLHPRWSEHPQKALNQRSGDSSREDR